MAYAALRSLAQILHQTLNRDYQYLILDEKQQIESLVEIITAIQKDFSTQKITQDEEREIRDSAYIVEDIIESRIIERFRTESAGNEDGSTEKKLVRFNVLEDWIVASSKSASSVSGLQIVGVGGVEKPSKAQKIYGIRQLARTFRFKASFLRTDVLHDHESPYPNAIWTLKRLAIHGTKIVLIINPSMRASEIMEKLSIFGFDTSLFVGAITIKDLLFQDHFSRADDAQFEELGSSSPAPSLQPWATYNPEAVSSKLYKSAMVMAGVDAADRCIVVTGDFPDTVVANAAGISSILMTDLFCGTIHGSSEFADIITVVRDLAARLDPHPTYVLPSFTW